MVSEPTVLIVGAGGSIPYGFPSGEGLVTEILAGLGDQDDLASQPSSALQEALLGAGFSKQDFLSFRDELRESHVYSVDAFLERRIDFSDVGKAAIAAALIPYERVENLYGNIKRDWYKYLFNRLLVNLQRDCREYLVILTYNYDRSLEYSIYNSFRAAFGLKNSGSDIRKFADRLRIIHLHGSLGTLPLMIERRIKRRKYGAVVSGEALLNAASQIEIIHEMGEYNEPFPEARQWLKEAKRIGFIGFGFHRMNITRLGLADILQPSSKSQIIASSFGMKSSPIPQIIASSFGMTNAEKVECAAYFPPQLRGSMFADSSLDALGLLREHLWLIS
jgi:hypothetical protein